MTTSCSELLSLIKQYQLSYYNVYCNNTFALSDNANCYCYYNENENTIYCINSSYYYFRFFSVLLYGLFFSVVCCILYNLFLKNTHM